MVEVSETENTTATANTGSTPGRDEPTPHLLDSVDIIPIGQPAGWLSFQCEGDAVLIRPTGPMPTRCTIRPAALFQQERGFPDVNTVMGRLVFPRGSTEAQSYRPFTRDARRRLCELYFPVEAMPEDDWPTSASRWSNWQAVAKRLLGAAGVDWGGLAARDVEELVELVPWPEPLEGCLLHALVQATHTAGKCVIEIGSRRGRSLSMLAMALRGVGSDSFLFSIDPQEEHRHNFEQARVALMQIGEADRLVQIKATSDRAATVLGRGVASFIFVDGDHSYDQLIRDFENYREVLASGGCLVFHDYGYGNHNGLPEADPDVRRALDDTVLSATGFRPLLLAHTQFAFMKE